MVAIPAEASATTSAAAVGDTLYIAGGPEANHVEVTELLGDQIKVTDPAGVSAGGGCSQPDPTEADCGGSGTTDLAANLGNGANKFAVNQYLSSWDSLTTGTIYGGTGNDKLDAGSTTSGASWTINGGAGNDTIQGANERDHVNGGPGDDTVSGANGNDVVHGGPGDDTVTGFNGNDQVFGDAGNDDVDGGDNDDYVDGGPGKDHLHGDLEHTAAGDDTVNAFDGQRDRVDCGFGSDIAYMDSQDLHSSKLDCEVQKVLPQAYKKHCHRKHGKRRCTRPHPLKHRVYKGKSQQGQAVKTGVDSKGKYFVFHLKKLTFTCQDGSTFDEVGVSLVPGDKQRMKKNGTVETSIDYEPSDVTNEVITIAAAFDGKHARGAVVGNATFGSSGACTSGKIGWTAKAG
jgi:Ca2+-binding RTX toxin-like protein